MKPNLRFLPIMAMTCALMTPSAIAQQVLRGHVPPAVSRSHLRPLERLPETNRLSLAIGLPLRNRAALTNLRQQLYDPASANYHRYLTPEQFAEKFGPTESDYQAVIAFAGTNGLEVTGTHPNRALLDVRGPVAAVEKALHIRMNRYQHPTENRVFFAPDAEPTLDLAVPVLHIAGLDNFVRPRALNQKQPPRKPGAAGSRSLGTGSGPGGEFIGNDFRAAYVPGVTLTGAGQTVGLFELGSGFYQSDITAYETMAGLPNVPVTPVLIAGYPGTPGPDNDEVSLDIEMAISMAPGLDQVLVYEGPDDGSTATIDKILCRMATDNSAKQLSASWGYEIDAVTDDIYLEFAVQGQSFFNASGDGDAWVGGIPYGSCEDTNITIVGGTSLTTSGQGGPYASEIVWNWRFVNNDSWNADGYIGSSGGISSDLGIPEWQQGIDMSANHGSTTMRNVPDVALTADNIYVAYANGASGEFGGTSCAAPLWAGFIALVNEQALAGGQPTVGFINPAIYASHLVRIQIANYSFETPAGAPGTVAGVPDGWMAANSYPYGVFNPPHGVYTNEAGFTLPAPAEGSQVLWIQFDNYVSQFLTNTLVANQTYALSGAIGNRGDGNGIQSPADQEYVFLLAGGTIIAQNVNLPHPAPGGFLPWTISYTTPASGFPTGPLEIRLGQVGSGQVNFDNIQLAYGQGLGLDPIFHDIISGDNTWPGSPTNFFAVPGYDLCTGWGTPAGATLINALAMPDALQIFPTAGFNASGGVGGPFSNAWQTLTLTNAGINQLNWTFASPAPWLNASPASGALDPGTASLVVVSLNSVASNLAVGTYTNTVVFTDANDSANIPRQYTLSILAAPSITNQPAHQSVLYGATALFSLRATGAQPLFYQWWGNGAALTDGENISGSTTGNLAVGNVSSASVGSYFVIVSNSVGSVTSVVASLSITPSAPVIFQQPASQVAPQGATVFFNPGAYGDPPFAYQWSFNGTNLPGATNASLVLTNLQLNESGNYALAISNALGGTMSSNAVLTVLIGASKLLTFDEFNLQSDDLFPITNGYQGLNFSNFNIVNAVLFTNLPPPTPPNWLGNAAGSSKSKSAGLTTNSGYQAGLISPSNVAFDDFGNPASISLPVPFDLLSAWLTAAWSDNLQLEVKGYAGGNLLYDSTYFLSPTAPTNIVFNYLGVTEVDFIPSGGTPYPGYSETGTQFVVDNMVVVEINAAPVINDFGPTNLTLAQGQETNLFVVATGPPPLSYQWQFSGSVLPGQTSATLVLSNIQPAMAGNYTVTVTNAYGSATSAVATVIVITPAPIIVTQPQNQFVAIGSNATFTVSALGTPPLYYQWQFSGSNLIGATGSNETLFDVSTANAGPYDVIVSNAYGSVTSSVAALVVPGGPPVIVAPPISQAVLLGGRVTFSVTAVGSGPLSYQWQLNGTNLSDDIVSTVAGSGYYGYSGDGGRATNAYMSQVFAVAADAEGDVFIADYSNQRIRKVDLNGIITTVAGNGDNQYYGDGGPATNASLNRPSGVAVDAWGNVFIADGGNQRIRKVDTHGIISTVAGNGVSGFSGDGSAATNASLFNPNGVALDAHGNFFIVDTANQRIRKVDTNGIIITVAGSGGYGYYGDGGAATNASFSDPEGVTVDAIGNLFIAETYNQVIRKVGTNGIITTVAGNGTPGYSGDGVAATNTSLRYPFGTVIDTAGNLIIVDTDNDLIR